MVGEGVAVSMGSVKLNGIEDCDKTEQESEPGLFDTSRKEEQPVSQQHWDGARKQSSNVHIVKGR